MDPDKKRRRTQSSQQEASTSSSQTSDVAATLSEGEENTAENEIVEHSHNTVGQQLCLPAKVYKKANKNYLAHKSKLTIEGRWIHKGGCGKTTTTFASAWNYVEETGEKVLIVDTDPQRNLSQLVLHRTVSGPPYYGDYDQYFKQYEGNHTVFTALKPVLHSIPLTPAQLTLVRGPENAERKGALYLLPGDYRIPLLEEQFSRACLESTTTYFHSTYGSFYHLLLMTAERYGITKILIDLSPSISSFNKLILFSCDSWTMTCQPDFFSWQAIESLSELIPGTGRSYALETKSWWDWANVLREHSQRNPSETSPAIHPLPTVGPIFNGAILSRFACTYGSGDNREVRTMVKNQKFWFDRIRTSLRKLVQQLPAGMKPASYPQKIVDADYIIGMIEEYGQLAAISQRKSRPVFTLSESDLTTYNAKTGKFELIHQDRPKLLKKIDIHRRDFTDISHTIFSVSKP